MEDQTELLEKLNKLTHEIEMLREDIGFIPKSHKIHDFSFRIDEQDNICLHCGTPLGGSFIIILKHTQHSNTMLMFCSEDCLEAEGNE